MRVESQREDAKVLAGGGVGERDSWESTNGL